MPKKKLLDLVRDKVRFKHYSYSTICAYIVAELNKPTLKSPLDF